MFKAKLKLSLILTGFLFLINCSSDEVTSLTVGEEFTSTNIRVLSIDTFAVKLTTMKFDSIVTSGYDRILIGQYNDDYMGKVKASSYFRIKPSSYYIDDDAVLDSVGLVMSYNSYYYNDTTQVSNLSVHKLIEKIKSEDTYNYNTTTFDYEVTSLGSKSFRAEPNSDSLYVALNYDFGNSLFKDIQDNIITDDQSLYQQLQGFTLQSGETDDSAIVGYDTTGVFLRFFYTIPSELESTELTYDFYLDATADASFNHIESELSGLAIENITDQEFNLESTETANISYNQSGVGYATRIEFPTITNLYDISSEGTILDATLYMQPVSTSYSATQPIAESLSLYTVDQNNNLVAQVTNSANNDYAYASLVTEDSEYNNSVYSMSVLDYIDQKLTEQPIIENALIIIPTDYNNSINKLLFYDSVGSNYQTKLVITYAIYEKN